MKTKILFLYFLASLFLFSFASAHTVQHDYYSGKDWNEQYNFNEKRFPVSDYKEGYTYRTSQEYLDNQEKYYSRNLRDYSESNYRIGRNTNKVTYYEYVPYMRGYEEKTCYDRPPKGKLFYIKCDF